jgi:hypothetical protein
VKADFVPVASSMFEEVKDVYTLKSVPGFYVIPNPFTPDQQKHWIKRCLKDFPIGNPTNISNLKGNKEYWTEWHPERKSMYTF